MNPRQGIETSHYGVSGQRPSAHRRKTVNPRQGIETDDVAAGDQALALWSEDSESSSGD